MLLLLRFLIGFYVYGIVSSSSQSTAIGNLAVVIRGQGALSTDEEPLSAATPDLWCEARKDGEVQPITWARFFRFKEKKGIAARLDNNNRRARLVFGNATAAQAGKYRCEIRTEDGELVFGNMFAYSRPVVHGNSSDPMEVSPSDPSLVTSGPLTFSRDSNATIVCPVYAYPHPHIVWYKDGIPLESSARVAFHKNAVEISGVEDTDAGMYRCVASNQFPIYVDGPEQEFEVKFDREVKIGVHYGWLLPLIVIVVMLILLFLIIYCCQAYKRYKTKQYHVAERERQIRNQENQRLTTTDYKE